MDNSEARAILAAYRPGELITDARFAEARAQAAADPELGQWWAEQQAVDRILTTKLRGIKVPADLKARITAWEKRSDQRRHRNRTTLLAAAVIIALAILFGSWRGPFEPAVSLGDYRDEMTNFIRIDPVLEMESPQLSRISAFLRKAGAPSQTNFPRNLLQMQHPLGCRTFRFRGQDVALICFGREKGELLHLFVVNRAAMPGLRASDKALHYQAVGDWMTATWVDGDMAYLLTVEGDRAKLEKYFGSS